jgi:AcrR family transcriptional regulator
VHPPRTVLTLESEPERESEITATDHASEVVRLVDATWTVAARTGSVEPGVREILCEAGLSTKAFYRHFRSKDELMLVALDRASALLVHYLEHRMVGVPNGLARVEVWIDGCLRQAGNPTAAQRILPWTLSFGRIATNYPEQLYRNQGRIKAVLEREVWAAVEDGSGKSPNPADDTQTIFEFTSHALQHHLITGQSPGAATTSRLVGSAYRLLGATQGRG